MDAAFLARIADRPDDDLARLVYADWLDEHNRPGDAERIRLAVQLDPDRDRYDDSAINAVRERIEALTPAVGDLPPGVEVEWRRGLPDTLCVPAPAFVEHGAALRERFPTVRRLVLFRLNGWGGQVAECEALRGVRELELACWYSDASADSLAHSRHVSDVERLTLWDARSLFGALSGQVATLADGPGFTALKHLHLVAWDEQFRWPDGGATLARELTTSAYNFADELYPIAPDFHGGGYLAGQVPDGSQVFVVNNPTLPTTFAARFDAAGRRVGRIDMPVPPGLVLGDRSPDGWETYSANWLLASAARTAHFAAATGFTPGFIRVERFALFETADEIGDAWVTFSRDRQDFAAAWGTPDDPDPDPAEAHDWYDDGSGAGGFAYRYIRDGQYVADCGNDWWADRRGFVHST